MTRRFLFAAILVLILFAAFGLHWRHSGQGSSAARVSGIRLPFVANDGQADARVAFTARTFGGPMFVTRDGSLVYNLPERSKAGPGWTGSGVALVERPSGSFKARPTGLEPVAARVNEYVGSDAARWRRGVKAYGAVSVGEPWPGTSLAVVARGNNVEKLFSVSPGADPTAITMTVEGARGLSVDGQGLLAAETDRGTVRFTRPVAFQEVDGARRPVQVAYRVAGNDYGFELGPYDRSREVVIDPLLAATYLGGNSANTNDGTDDQPWAIATDASGNLYVAGATGSTDFPSKAGGYDNTYGSGTSKAFVLKMSPDLTTLQAATFFGGGGHDLATTLALRGGSLYIGGHTTSADLPVTPGCYDNTLDGNTNAFVAKFSADLSTLQAATYFGNGQEQWPKIALDPSGNVVIVGETFAGVPLTADAFQTAFYSYSGYGNELFVSRLSTDLSSLLASTLLGSQPQPYGYGYEYGPSVAVDNQGRIYVGCFSEGINFPTTSGAYSENGGEGYHIVRFNSGLTTLQAGTYLAPGAAGVPATLQLALDASGRVYAAGWNHSEYGEFPTTSGTFMPVRQDNTYWDIGIARLDADLTTVQKGTYIGGTRNDYATGLVAASDGSVYVVGQTESSNFPMTADSYRNYRPTNYAVFAARLDNTFSTLLGATYLPQANPYGNNPRAQVALDPSGNAFVSWCISSTLLETTTGAYQPSFTNIAYSFDGAIAKFDANFTGGTAPPPPPPPDDNTVPAAPASSNHGCQASPGGGDGVEGFASFAAILLLFLPAALRLRKGASRGV